MRRSLKTLIGRLAVLQLGIYAVLLPVLFIRLDTLVRTNLVATFTQHARAYGGSLARELELGEVLESPSRSIAFLDSAVEGGESLYAAVEFNGRLLGSSVVETPPWIKRRGNDSTFTGSPETNFAVMLPFRHADSPGTLYLGFDKRATLVQVRAARRQIMLALGFYGLASLCAAVLLARVVSAPLTQLRLASRRIAGGDADAQLGTASSMVEIVDLSRDLEHMRSELVGATERLRSEMQRHQIEHARRTALENILRHEQRLATIGTLAGGLAHEFNNILVPVVLFTEESLDELGADHPARAYLHRVLSAAKRATEVVSKLLAFSRPTGGHQVEPLDVGKIAHEAMDLSQALIPASIEVRRHIADDAPPILGDSTLLNQVILNLCSNAVQAMRGRGGTLTVTVASHMKKIASQPQAVSVPVVDLRVRDTGHGMTAEVRERIFEPFFTTRGVGEGSGLGLSIVHGIVASMGGMISVSSNLGSGTEFVVEFPGIAKS